HCQSRDVMIVENICLEGGYDAFWFDHEHSGVSIAQTEHATRAARGVGLETFVRMAATDYAAVMRRLEAGAGGIMASQVRTVREVEEIVRWVKFYPQGLRGYNGSGVDGNYGALPPKEYTAKANSETFVVIQIEHID